MEQKIKWKRGINKNKKKEKWMKSHYNYFWLIFVKIIKLNVGKKRLKGFLKYFQTLLSYNLILILDFMNEPQKIPSLRFYK